MGEVVNLNKYRKVRQRVADEKRAVENRAKFGRGKLERDQARERLQRLWADQEEDEFEEEDDAEAAAEDGVPATEDEVPTLLPGPREGQREAVHARALLEKAERLLERISPEDRVEVERHMERVRTYLTDRQWDRVKASSDELADILFYLEDV